MQGENKINKYFYKMVIIISICCLIPLVFFIPIVNHSVKETIKTEFNSMHTDILEINIQKTNQLFSTLLTSFWTYADDTSFQQICSMHKTDMEYFEKMKAPFKDENLQTIYDYVTLKGKVFNKLDQLTAISKIIGNVYLLDKRKDIIFSDTRKIIELKDSPDKEYFESIESISKPCISTMHINSTGDKIISILIPDSVQNLYALVIDIDLDSLGKILFEDKWRNSSIIICDENNNVLISNNKAISEYSDIMKLVKSSNISLAYSGGTTFPYWKFFSLVNLDILNSNLTTIFNTMALGICLVIIIAVLCAFMASRHLYKPINILKQKINPEISADYNDNFFSFMARYVDISEQTRKRMEENIKEMAPYYNERKLLSFLYAKPNTMEKFQSENNGFFLFAFRFAAINDGAIPEDLIVKEYLRNKTFSFFGKNGAQAKDFSECFYLFVDADMDSYAKAQQFASDISSEIQNTLNIECRTGVSDYHESQSEIKDARMEADIALASSIIRGNPVTYQEANRKNQYIANTESMDYLTECLFDNISVNNAKNSINYWIKLNNKIGELPSQYKEGKHIEILLRTYHKLMEQLNVFGISTDMEIYTKIEKDYHSLVKGNRLVPQSNLIRHIEEICDFGINNGEDANKDSIIETTIKNIRQCYMMNYGLTEYASMVSLNPDYLGRLFKIKTGWNFVDFITKIRIDEAKNILISNRNIKIKEVGIMVGFFNSNYFIKVFKNYTGKTPKEYQKENNNEDRNENNF